jgi:hypothetical protein
LRLWEFVDNSSILDDVVDAAAVAGDKAKRRKEARFGVLEVEFLLEPQVGPVVVVVVI